ncbi:hypothetical protein [Propionivibrio sp.]|uniref:hypothetical protein n=1 Tax=Propionivibrio sp. TaxID=2212460 RepID=UPI003BF19C24
MNRGTRTGTRGFAASRRLLSVLTIVLGAVLIFLAPETWAGLVLLVLGVLVEVIGMSIGHQRSHHGKYQDSP